MADIGKNPNATIRTPNINASSLHGGTSSAQGKRRSGQHYGTSTSTNMFADMNATTSMTTKAGAGSGVTNTTAHPPTVMMKGAGKSLDYLARTKKKTTVSSDVNHAVKVEEFAVPKPLKMDTKTNNAATLRFGGSRRTSGEGNANAENTNVLNSPMFNNRASGEGKQAERRTGTPQVNISKASNRTSQTANLAANNKAKPETYMRRLKHAADTFPKSKFFVSISDAAIRQKVVNAIRESGAVSRVCNLCFSLFSCTNIAGLYFVFPHKSQEVTTFFDEGKTTHMVVTVKPPKGLDPAVMKKVT